MNNQTLAIFEGVERRKSNSILNRGRSTLNKKKLTIKSGTLFLNGDDTEEITILDGLEGFKFRIPKSLKKLGKAAISKTLTIAAKADPRLKLAVDSLRKGAKIVNSSKSNRVTSAAKITKPTLSKKTIRKSINRVSNRRADSQGLRDGRRSSSLPSWVLPLGIGAGAGALLLLKKGKK
jgi:hypothetical protein